MVLSSTNMAHVNNTIVVQVELYYHVFMVFFELLWSKYHGTPKYFKEYHGITYTLVN